MNKSYFIKEDYKHRKMNKTLDENREELYWDSNRINASYFYQFDIYKYIANYISEKNDSSLSVIDIGSGISTKLMRLIYPVCKNVTAIDQKNPIEFCRRKYSNSKASFIEDNFEKPSLKNYEKFNIIICSDVIEHLDNPDILLKYIKKFANKETLIFISTPERDIMWGENNIMSPQEDHVREWNNNEFKKYLESSGFIVKKQINLPGLKFTFKYPFIIEFLSKKFKGTLNANQLAVCKIK